LEQAKNAPPLRYFAFGKDTVYKLEQDINAPFPMLKTSGNIASDKL